MRCNTCAGHLCERKKSRELRRASSSKGSRHSVHRVAEETITTLSPNEHFISGANPPGGATHRSGSSVTRIASRSWQRIVVAQCNYRPASSNFCFHGKRLFLSRRGNNQQDNQRRQQLDISRRSSPLADAPLVARRGIRFRSAHWFWAGHPSRAT